MATKYVFSFGPKGTDGDAKMREILGGKGAGLAEMTTAGVPVPPGFTVSTEVCNIYFENNQHIPNEIEEQVDKALADITARVTAMAETQDGLAEHETALTALDRRFQDATAQAGPKQAKRLTARLNEEWVERTGDETAVLARAHHGSVSREQRAVIGDDLKAGRRPSDMQPDEAAVYDLCMELSTTHAVSDATYRRAAALFSEQQIVDLLAIRPE